MTHCEIISQLYQSQDLDDCITKIVKQKYREDFRQELFVIILDMPEDKIVQLYNNSVLKYFVVRICLNLVRQKRNIYHKKYLIHEHHNVDYAWEETLVTDSIDLTDRIIEEKKEQDMCNHIESNLEGVFGTHYYKSLVKLIAEKGSMREVSRQTGIHISSISKAVKKVREHLQSL